MTRIVSNDISHTHSHTHPSSENGLIGQPYLSNPLTVLRPALHDANVPFVLGVDTDLAEQRLWVRADLVHDGANDVHVLVVLVRQNEDVYGADGCVVRGGGDEGGDGDCSAVFRDGGGGSHC
jgi:hypothetical protein